MSTQKVEVLIAVAVDSYGDWSAAGWCDKNGNPVRDAAMDTAILRVDDGEARYWIKAELELPAAKVIQGTVTKDGAQSDE